MSLPDRDDSNVRRGPWPGAGGESPASEPPAQGRPHAGGSGPLRALEPPPTPPSLRKRIHATFLKLLGRNDPPELVAASFALGVFISFTPLFGFHALIAIALALLLRLKKVDVLLGTLVVNPVTFAPVSALAIPLGRFLLRAERALIHDLPWRDMVKSPRQFWREAGPAMREVGIHWGVGMLALGILTGVFTYLVLVPLIRKHRAKEAAATAQSPP